MSYVYQQSEPGCYTVGFYGPEEKWHAESDHSTSEEAAARCNYLNGGSDLAGVLGVLEDIRKYGVAQECHR